MQSRRRRRAVAESSDEEALPPLASAPGSIAVSSRVTEDHSKRPKLEGEGISTGANVTGGASPQRAPKVTPTTPKTRTKRSRSQFEPCAVRRSPTSNSNLATEIPTASSPSRGSASTTPVSNQALEVDEQSQMAKLRTAARQYLRSHQMEERLQALKKLSRHGLQLFYEKNKDRKKGEWFWDPVDERIGSSNLAEVAGTTIPSNTNPSRSEPVEGIGQIAPKETDAKDSDLNFKSEHRSDENRRIDNHATGIALPCSKAADTALPNSSNPSGSQLVEGVRNIPPKEADVKASDLNSKLDQRRDEHRRVDDTAASTADDSIARQDAVRPELAAAEPRSKRDAPKPKLATAPITKQDAVQPDMNAAELHPNRDASKPEFASADSITKQDAVEPELASADSRSKGDSATPEVGTAETTSKQDAGKSKPRKPVLIEAGARHGYPTRYGPRMFTPVLQRSRGSRELTAPTSFRLPVVDATASASQRSSASQSSKCRHIQCEQPTADSGCHWVCSKCGEMLFYDGWVRERVLPNHLEPMSRGIRGVDHLEMAGDV